MFANKEMMVLTGNWLFVCCCICYLIWWSVAFRPGFEAPMIIKSLLFVLTAFFGVFALVMIIKGCEFSRGILIAGVVAYIALLLLTNFLMHRQVTTELILIVFWVCMELTAVNSLYSYGVFSKTALIAFAVIVIAAAAVSLVCYLKYYDMEPMKAFFDGMVPLILFALVMAAVAVYQMKC